MFFVAPCAGEYDVRLVMNGARVSDVRSLLKPRSQVRTYDTTELVQVVHCTRTQGRHLGKGKLGVYEPPRIYNCNFFPVNCIFETALLLREQYVT